MSQDIKLTKSQEVWCIEAALERMKDAPVTSSEISEIRRDLFHLIKFGSSGLTEENWYAKILLETMPKSPRKVV